MSEQLPPDGDIPDEFESVADETVPAPPSIEPPAKASFEPERHFVGTGLFWGLVVGIILAVLVIILAAQNTQSTTLSFLGFDWSTPLIVIILVSLLVGIVLDEIVGLIFRGRRRRILAEREELKRLKKGRGPL
jgi:uncharacterized integral membrane protein